MKLREKTKKVLTAPESFTIHRKDWLMNTTNRATSYSTRMLNYCGGMCCLGFFSHACGVGSEDLLNTAVPLNVKENIPRLAKNGHHTKLAEDAMEINDTVMALTVREEKLTKLFKKHGIEVKFVGKYPESVIRQDAYDFPGDYK